MITSKYLNVDNNKIVSLSTRSKFQSHPFHLVSPSPWPLFTSLSLLALASSAILAMHGFFTLLDYLLLAFLSIVFTLTFWFKDVAVEATYLGHHTAAVRRGLSLGVSLFIASEALFFLAIFWTFFHSAISPAMETGVQWPPTGIESINAFELPLLNSAILLSSGFFVTYAHHCIIKSIRLGSLHGLIYTLILALIFTAFQGLEYKYSSFTLSDSVFGSCFYFGTGFHGFHVLIGTVFILVSFLRQMVYHFTASHHLGLESSILYWHFVDIVWLILFISVYYWGA